MNKGSAFGVLVALVACAGVGFSVVEMKKMSGSLAQLEERLAKVETVTAAPPAPASGSAGSSSAAAPAPATMAEVAQEIARLKSEMAQVRDEQATMSAAADSKPKDTKVARPSNEEMEAAVNAVLEKKEQERRDRDAKRTQEWQGRATQGMVDNLVKELGLTEQQKTQVTEIVTAQMAAFRDAFSNRKEGEDPMAKVTELRKDTDTKIKAVLTPEQGTKYDEIAKNPMAMWGGGMGGFGGGRRGGNNGGAEGESR